MLITKLTLNYVLENKIKFIVYFLIIACTYPLESIVMSKSIGKLSQLIPKYKTQKKNIIKLLFIVCVAWSFIKLAGIAKHYMEDYIYPQFYMKIRRFFFDNIINRYKINFKNISIGNTLGNIITVPSIIKNTFLRIITVFVPSILTMIYINGYFYTKNFNLFLLTVSAPFVSFLIYKVMGVKCIDYSTERDSFFSKMNEKTKDKLSNLFSIYVNNNIKNEILEYKDLEDEYLKINLKTKNCGNELFTVFNIQEIVYFIAIISLLFYLFKTKKINSETMVSSLVMLTYYFTFITNLSYELPYLSSNVGQLINAEKYMKEISKKNKIEYNSTNKITNGNIEIKNVSFGYNNNLILTDKSFTIKDKTNFGIFGKSGCGKSTFIKLLLGFYRIKKGAITISGNDLYSYNLEYLRDTISYVNQDTKLFNETILKNINYGLNIPDQKIYDFIKENNITIFDNLKNGLHTKVGINGSKISGGQKQIVMLLKLFLKKSQIYIMDEPTTALDPKIKNIILNLIVRLSRDKTVIIISHDNDIKRILDEIIYF